MASIRLMSLHNATCKPAALCYSGGSVETAADGFGDLEYERRTTAARRYFYVRALLRASFNGRAMVGIPSGMPVCFRAGSPTLPFACPPHLAMGSGFNAQRKEAAMRANTLARPEQTQSHYERIDAVLSQMAALANLMYADGRKVFSTLSESCQAELRNAFAHLGDELVQLNAAEVNHG